MKNYLIFLFLLSFVYAQAETKMAFAELKDSVAWEMVWASRMDGNVEIIGSDNVHVYKEWYLKGGGNDSPPTILAFNTQTGNKDWEYQHEGSLQKGILYNAIKENIYIAITQDGMLGIDLETRKLIWEVDLLALNLLHRKGIQFHRDHFYHPVSWNFGNSDRIEHLLKMNYRTGKFEFAFSLGAEEDWSPNFSPPAFWTNPVNGNTLMIFNNGKSNNDKSPQESPQDLIAVDVRTKEVVWKANNFSAVPTNLLIAPVVYKNDIITGGDWSIYSYNAQTGKLNWRKEFPQKLAVGIWNKTNHLLVGDKLYLNPDSDEVICIDAATGEEIWTNPKAGPNSTDNMIHHNGLLIFTSWGHGSLMVMDAKTGKTLHQEYPFANSQYNNDIAYDPKTDLFFTSTYKHAIGFRIKKTNL